jgi:hypothetical protein
MGAHKTGSQAVKTGSQAVKQEVNKVLKTGFLFYGMTTCVMGRCKQISTYFLLSADASLDIWILPVSPRQPSPITSHSLLKVIKFELTQ